MKKEVLIIGAGKIGRGFIAHLFYRSGYKIWLLDASKEIVSLLHMEKKYRIDLAGQQEDTTEYIRIEDAFTLEEKEKVNKVIAGVSIIASSVGAANIESVAAYVGQLLLAVERKDTLNWIICENANSPASTIRRVLLQDADERFKDFIEFRLGLVETQVLRTGMQAKADVLRKEPTALRMQDWRTLPLDKDAFVGSIPDVEGFRPRTNFKNELLRKLYTFNGTNGPIAYVGYANGYSILHEAALAYIDYFETIQEESAYGLVHEFGFDEKEQRAFMAQAMKKYTDPAINDQIERNAADSKRKLARNERLVGPALLCLKHGRTPSAYARAIAAAYHYAGSQDEGTREVQDFVRRSGVAAAITTYSGIGESSPLYHLVLSSYNQRDFIFK